MSRPSILTGNVTVVFNSNTLNFLVYELPQICHYSAALNRFLSSSDIINGLLKCFFMVFFIPSYFFQYLFHEIIDNIFSSIYLYFFVIFVIITAYNFISIPTVCVFFVCFCIVYILSYICFVYILESFLFLLQNLHRWQKVLVIVEIVKF